MRTTDFSRAPRKAQATAMFVGATRYSGPLAWARLTPRWLRMVRQMKRMPGYCGHQVFYEAPWTLGTIGWFETRDDLLRFARTGEHRELVQWVTSPDRKQATGGWIRLWSAEEAGYSNGVWRAEGDELDHIERFTPVTGEVEGPPVARERRGRARARG
ncbi:hypothetical protein SAMN05445756_1077 [Kytococcus aerolatus]|uniref:DUF4188 domain-containing protein n=1 Tax=Kytococcus aerolatus TaxID=592308 RepID=A0A212TDX8_9MICO|nr:DUF4188 domain-containing protein [Kytococcus aerolatus]SNC64268.1 hypothetical protein SAMN05445756_1077 [Kytococcus aerolatus]